MATSGSAGEFLRCSFCGRPQRLVIKLIAGPGVYICNVCVHFASETIAAEGGDTTTRRHLYGEDQDRIRRQKDRHAVLRARKFRNATISGTRFRVGLLTDLLLGGASIDELISEYPCLGSKTAGNSGPTVGGEPVGNEGGPRLRLDDDLGRSVKRCFEDAGFDVDSVWDSLPPGASRGDVIEAFKEANRVLVSLDAAFFADVVLGNNLELGAGIAILAGSATTTSPPPSTGTTSSDWSSCWQTSTRWGRCLLL